MIHDIFQKVAKAALREEVYLESADYVGHPDGGGNFTATLKFRGYIPFKPEPDDSYRCRLQEKQNGYIKGRDGGNFHAGNLNIAALSKLEREYLMIATGSQLDAIGVRLDIARERL
jgi:hypothetical protein